MGAAMIDASEPSGRESPSAAVIKAQLAKIQNSSGFIGAERLRQFLEYVVTQTLAGHEEELTEWRIAMAVFHKDQHFDPRLDAIVRSTANRLRSKLKTYYAGKRHGDEVLITLPAGRYIPRFESMRPVEPARPADTGPEQSNGNDKVSAGQRAAGGTFLEAPNPARTRSRWTNRGRGRLILAICAGSILAAVALWTWLGARETPSRKILKLTKEDGGWSDRTSNGTSVLPPRWGRILARATSEGGSPTKFRLEHPGQALAVTPDGLKVYATDAYSHFLSVVHTANGRVETITLPQAGGQLVVSPDGRSLYVGSMQGGIIVIDTRTDRLVPPVIPTPGPIFRLALTPDGEKLFIAASRHGIWRLLTVTRELRQVTTQIIPEYVELDASGRNLYVSYQGGGPSGGWGHDALEIFDAKTEESLGTVSGPPIVGSDLSVSPDSRLAIVDGMDACISPQYDHVGCPTVPSRVFHFLQLPNRRFVKTLGMPLEANSARFIDRARLFFDGDAITIMDAIQYTWIERWEHKPDYFRGVALLPSRRQAYVAKNGGKEIFVFEAERPECSSSPEGLMVFFPADGAPQDIVGGLALTALGSVRFGSGRVGQAFVLDGTTGYLQAPQMGHYRFCYRDSSVAAYVKFAAVHGDMTLLDRTSTDGSTSLRLAKAADQHFALEFQTKRNGPVRLVSSMAVVADRWYQVCVTKDDRQLALYVNGILQDRIELRAKRDVEVEWEEIPIIMGATKDRKQFLHGKLDEILFYDRALSDSDVRRLYEVRQSSLCRI